MKIQCDVCNKDEASVFCTADEAALCGGCDHRVHHANKLASKHHRFSLLSPSSKQVPVCDVCQERRAFLFCQQDRAILCRECDLPIHTVNEHTRKHNRFLLTGVKLSATSTVYTPAPAPSQSNGCDFVPDLKSETSSVKKKAASASVSTSAPSKVANTGSESVAATLASTASAVVANNEDGNNNVDSNFLLTSHGNGSNGSTSSISEYLIEMLPGWHFEDFLDSCSASFGFCKKADGSLPFRDSDDRESDMSSFSSESLGIWVPQAQTPPSGERFCRSNGGITAFKQTKEPNLKSHSRWSNYVFAVPEMSPSSAGFKRPRPF